MKYRIATREEIYRALSGQSVRVKCSDKFQACDVRRVFRALDNPIEIGVRGSDVIVPREYLQTVRDYLAGKISPSRYRRNMPADYYGESARSSIYERKLIYV